MKREITDIIAKFLAGDTSWDEDVSLTKWLGESYKNLEEFKEYEKVWNALEISYRHKQFDSLAAFNKFKSDTRKQSKIKIQKPVTLKNLFRNTARWAAIGLLLITLGSVTTYFFTHVLKTNNFEVKVPHGSRSNITLVDGTTVWLNAGSRLTYSQNFGVTGRTVTLEGEGYFNVARNNRSPFTVITSQLEITALGTSFNVKSYPEEDIIQATLVSGSLLVTRSMYKEQEKGLVMEPNQQITYYIDSRQLLLTSEKVTEQFEKEAVPNIAERDTILPQPRITLNKEVDPEIFTAWKDNRLIFDNETFENIAVKLERRFGARIIIKDDDIKKKRFKGRFDEITIEQALSALKFASPFEFQIKQDTIYITSQ